MVNKENTKNLIIDFSQVKAIDSCGISSMLLAHQLSNQSEGLAIFVSLCKQIKDLLKLTNLDKQLYIFSSINEVMTLIEPAMKSKRGSRVKSQPPVDEIIDELLCEDLDLIVEPDLHDEHLSEHLDEQLVEPDELPIQTELSDSWLKKRPDQKNGDVRKNQNPNSLQNQESTRKCLTHNLLHSSLVSSKQLPNCPAFMQG